MPTPTATLAPAPRVIPPSQSAAGALVRLAQGAEVATVRRTLEGLGLWTRVLDSDADGHALQLAAHSAPVRLATVQAVPGVAEVFHTSSAHPRVDRQAGRAVAVRPGLAIGPGAPPTLMAGPCSVESPAQIQAMAAHAAEAGATLLRGGAFKPRTSPYAFRGHGARALGWLRDAADQHGLAVVTEVMSEQDVAAVSAQADMLQVGSRNMQNFALLREVGAAGKAVLLKRGAAATIGEWLQAGEHLLQAGAAGVVFCERGIVGFDPETRNLLDLGAVALLAHAYGQPVIVDPSHGAGRRDLVAPLARAGMAAGAHGLMIESHPDARAAKSDGPQALTPAALQALGRELVGAPTGRGGIRGGADVGASAA